MKAKVGMQVEVVRSVSRQVGESISETVGTETLIGTIESAKIIPGGYTDGREFVMTTIRFADGDIQVAGDVGAQSEGFPVLSVKELA